MAQNRVFSGKTGGGAKTALPLLWSGFWMKKAAGVFPENKPFPLFNSLLGAKY
jgi:hypothetical protein